MYLPDIAGTATGGTATSNSGTSIGPCDMVMGPKVTGVGCTVMGEGVKLPTLIIRGGRLIVITGISTVWFIKQELDLKCNNNGQL